MVPLTLASSAVSEDRPLKTVPQVTCSFKSAAAAGVFTRHHCLAPDYAVWTGAVKGPAQAAGCAPRWTDEGKPASSRLILLIGLLASSSLQLCCLRLSENLSHNFRLEVL